MDYDLLSQEMFCKRNGITEQEFKTEYWQRLYKISISKEIKTSGSKRYIKTMKARKLC
jgi:hypothetical protein